MSDKLSTLILPGYGNSGPGHWQSHWERRDPSCVRVRQRNWDTPHCADWVAGLDTAVAKFDGAAVLVAHSAACAMLMHWVETAQPARLQRIRGAMLVAPADPDGPDFPADATGFGPMPLQRLPFASIVVASSNDPYVDATHAAQFADAWGGRFVLLQHAGHINADSGHGAWLDGFELLNSLRGMLAEA